MYNNIINIYINVELKIIRSDFNFLIKGYSSKCNFK